MRFCLFCPPFVFFHPEITCSDFPEGLKRIRGARRPCFFKGKQTRARTNVFNPKTPKPNPFTTYAGPFDEYRTHFLHRPVPYRLTTPTADRYFRTVLVSERS